MAEQSQNDTNKPVVNAFQLMQKSSLGKKDITSSNKATSSKSQHSKKKQKLDSPNSISKSESRFSTCSRCGKEIIIYFISEHESECDTEKAKDTDTPQQSTSHISREEAKTEVESTNVLSLLRPQPASAFQKKKKREKEVYMTTLFEQFHLTFQNQSWSWSWISSSDSNKEANDDNATDSSVVWKSKFTIKDKSSKSFVVVETSTNYAVTLFDAVNEQNDNQTQFDQKFLKISWRDYQTLGKQFHLPPSVLKSVLQKNVRLSRPWPAVRAALAIMRLDFQQFIRRLSIIIVEDCILHPALPFVWWLTVASSSSEFQLTDLHINTCLQIVYEIASVSIRDPYDTADRVEKTLKTNRIDPNESPIIESGVPSFTQINELPMLEGCLVKSLLGRATFGGMTGDMIMLKTLARVWYNRFKYNSPPVPTTTTTTSNSLTKSDDNKKDDGNESTTSLNWFNYLLDLYSKVHVNISHTTVGPMVPDDVILSAIDFHCSSIIDKTLAKPHLKTLIETLLHQAYGPSVDIEDKLRRLIWIFRSSLNNKQLLLLSHVSVPDEDSSLIEEKASLGELWKQIRQPLDDYSRAYIWRCHH